VDPSDGSIDYFYDVSSSFKHMDDNWSVASVVAYDETNNCLIITGTAYNSGTYYRQHIGKFDLTTKTMTGVLEDTYWTTNYHDQHQVSPNGKFWYRYNSEEDGTGDDYLNCLDIATMTVEHSKKLADLDVGSGKQVTKISYWTEVDSESGAFFARPTAGTGLNSQDLLKISVSGISSEFLRSNGKPGWGGKGKGSTVTITYFSVAEKTEPPPPNGNSGFEEWGNPFAWVGPGRIGRMPHRLGKGIK
jgi:hypothetical protein